MIKSSIDIGSNTVQFLLGKLEPDKTFTQLRREQFVTGLGRDLDRNKKFLNEAMEETFDALKKCCEFVKEAGLNAESVKVTATEASRVAGNAREFYTKVEKTLGLKILIIPADKEAYYSAKGILLGNCPVKSNEFVALDIGGASSELIKIQKNPFQILKTISLPMGSVRVSNWQIDGSIEERLKDIYQKFEFDEFENLELVALAGTMTSIANIYLDKKDFDERSIHGLKISYQSFQQLLNRIQTKSIEELDEAYPFLGKRVKVIKSGFFVADQIFKKLNINEFIISTNGLVHGLIQDS
ncbi:MAG: hypothetical protein H6621_05615 [Halobacteriovoraceae bacterium]|nr:hypothetical protein [Halobacteriovoraceae bacterium]